jgi:GNAT superfamily N-acetyltransferase
MVNVTQVDLQNKRQVNRFIQFHYDLYKTCPQWVPPFYSDIRMMMNPNKHPFYEHSDADFFVAERNGEVVGRIAALENKPFNKYHQTKEAVFYLFDSVDDLEVASALFDRAFDWAKKRGLDKMIGPKGFSPFDGYGIQVQGHDHRQMMIMMNYNYPYYQNLVEGLGFTKEVDFVSTYMHRDSFILPDKVHEIARRVRERGSFHVQNFKSKKELIQWSIPIGRAYNDTFVNNWEYYPLTDREIDFTLKNLLTVAVPELIKIIMYKEKIVGFLLGFPDISVSLQRQGGRITPWGLVDFMRDLKKTDWISLNGAGVLPEFQGRGGNALLYSEMENTIRNSHFVHAELTQVAETTKQMRADLANVGSDPYKNHRVYHRDI